MFPRITDLWPNLLRRFRPNQNELEEPLLPDGAGHQPGDHRLVVEEQQILEEHRNLYWTRLMNI